MKHLVHVDIKNVEPFKPIIDLKDAKLNSIRKKKPGFFTQRNGGEDKTNENMEELIHITAPANKKKELECENYDYLQDCKKIKIKDLDVEENDSFYKTTFPIEKISKLLSDFAGNFSKQN